ncbi:MAG TPA: 4Fe-4S binding protein [Clostridia bacterium]|nr:4Fe-4S binding protein [Clostridia bacterium]
MKELVVISGKGGTGKTSLVGSFAVLSKNKVLADCDVDAANLHLLVNPKIRKSEEFHGLSKAIINPEECNRCGQCEAACRFGAIKEFRIDPTFCEGCRVCFKLCPVGAISMEKNLSGHWFIGDTLYGPLVFARLGIAEENSGKLVAEVRRAAKAIAEDDGKGYIITDGPPGVGCPVIASLTGADLCLVVTEPTVAGKHDLQRVLHLTSHFRVPALVCINKADLDEDKTREIRKFCDELGVEIAGSVPFDEEIIRAIMQGIPPVVYSSGVGAKAIEIIWKRVAKALG